MYGAFKLFNSDAIAGSVNAAPNRIPASPKALESVCITTKFGNSRTHSAKELFSGAKSMYASSRTTMPFQVGCSSIGRTDSFGISVPVGFPGEQRYNNLMAGSEDSVSSIFGTLMANCCSGRSGT